MNKPAFPVPMITYPNGDSESVVDYGMTLREHAALTLRVPDSGDERIDAMIRQANRRDAAVAAMQGYMSGCSPEITGDYDMDNEPEVCKQHFDAVAVWCIGYADALIAKLEESRNV